MKSKLFVFALMVVLTAMTVTPLAAAPLLAPCAPGAAYDPACDVNHDGAVNVLDVQITAGHWNQTGTWLSDNSHNHLGQLWTGNTPLKIQGAFGAPDYAPLLLNNTAGVGLSIAASDTAVYVDSAGYHGLWVASAANDGLHVNSAGRHGVYVGSADHFGVYVVSAYDGVDAAGDTYAGYFVGDIVVIGNCLGCLQANFAVNEGDHALQPGDPVSILAVTRTDFDTGPVLWQVTQAQPGQAIVGVAAGRAEVDIREEHRATETGKRLVPREGAAQPGDYVSIVYSGPMQVRATGPILAGAKLTIDENGGARGLRKTEVNGVPVAEDAPVLGIALNESQDGMVWVLVNPQ